MAAEQQQKLTPFVTQAIVTSGALIVGMGAVATLLHLSVLRRSGMRFVRRD